MSKALFQYPEPTSSPNPKDVSIEHYIRPNFDNMISPLSSTNFSIEYLEKERKARKKIRYLLDEQAQINELLADENEILGIQQKSLLKLLITKDKQLESLAASLTSTLNTSATYRETFNCETQTFLFENLERIFHRKIKSAWKQLELGSWINLKEKMNDEINKSRHVYGFMYLNRNIKRHEHKTLEMA